MDLFFRGACAKVIIGDTVIDGVGDSCRCLRCCGFCRFNDNFTASCFYDIYDLTADCFDSFAWEGINSFGCFSLNAIFLRIHRLHIGSSICILLEFFGQILFTDLDKSITVPAQFRVPSIYQAEQGHLLCASNNIRLRFHLLRKDCIESLRVLVESSQDSGSLFIPVFGSRKSSQDFIHTGKHFFQAAFLFHAFINRIPDMVQVGPLRPWPHNFLRKAAVEGYDLGSHLPALIGRHFCIIRGLQVFVPVQKVFDPLLDLVPAQCNFACGISEVSPCQGKSFSVVVRK